VQEKKRVGRPPNPSKKSPKIENVSLADNVKLLASSMSAQEMAEELDASEEQINEILKKNDIYTIVELTQPRASVLTAYKFDILYAKCKCKFNAGKTIWEIAHEIYVHPDTLKVWIAAIKAEAKKET
jgi:hypothetical protein